jgi:hypothetical protein
MNCSIRVVDIVYLLVFICHLSAFLCYRHECRMQHKEGILYSTTNTSLGCRVITIESVVTYKASLPWLLRSLLVPIVSSPYNARWRQLTLSTNLAN